MSQTMRVCERVTKRRLRLESNISENQSGFNPQSLTIEVIDLLKRLIENYRKIGEMYIWYILT